MCKCPVQLSPNLISDGSSVLFSKLLSNQVLTCSAAVLLMATRCCCDKTVSPQETEIVYTLCNYTSCDAQGLPFTLTV